MSYFMEVAGKRAQLIEHVKTAEFNGHEADRAAVLDCLEKHVFYTNETGLLLGASAGGGHIKVEIKPIHILRDTDTAPATAGG